MLGSQSDNLKSTVTGHAAKHLRAHFPFMALPAELRVMVYHWCFSASATRNPSSPHGDHVLGKPMPSTLLLVNKTIYREAFPIFSREAELRFETFFNLCYLECPREGCGKPEIFYDKRSIKDDGRNPKSASTLKTDTWGNVLSAFKGRHDPRALIVPRFLNEGDMWNSRILICTVYGPKDARPLLVVSGGQCKREGLCGVRSVRGWRIGVVGTVEKLEGIIAW